MLRLAHQPDFMLVHPMGIDHAGHCYGADTKEYRGSALTMDSVMSHYLPRWREAGYTIVITADHGMNTDGNHGGSLPDVRETPLFCLGPDFEAGVHTDGLSQLAIAPLLCQLLGIPTAAAMQALPIPGYRSPVTNAPMPQTSRPQQISPPTLVV